MPTSRTRRRTELATDAAARPSLIADARRQQRTLIAAAGVLCLAVAVVATLVLGAIHPRLRDITDLTRDLRRSHEAMLDQETGIRGWLATGDDAFLAPYRDGVVQRAELTADVARNRLVTGGLGVAVVDVLMAQERWVTGWADVVTDLEVEDIGRPQLRRVLLQGMALFEEYRAANDVATGMVVARRDAAMREERVAIQVGVSVVAALSLALLVSARHARSRLVRGIEQPVTDLLDTLARMRTGDLTARPQSGAPAELAELSEGLAAMADALEADHAALGRARADAEEQALMSATVVDVAGDVAGSHSPAEVSRRVAVAAAAMVEAATATVWLLGDEDLLHPVHSTTADVLASVALGEGAVGGAARDARTQLRAGRDHHVMAVPMVVGASVVGVLEVRGDRTRLEARTAPLELLAIQAGAALRAARVASRTADAAERDGLTGLYNRRRFDADLAVEASLSARGGRDVSLVLIDLDHFKRLNDE